MIKNLAELETLDREGLSDHWLELYSINPPKNLSVQMMQRFIAFEFQSKRSKGLTAKSKRKINQLQKPTELIKRKSNQLKAGAQILRDWNGVTHKIEVTDKGFLWKGEVYKSLTAIAKLITGTHWSGPRFFGLNPKAQKPISNSGLQS